MGTTVRWNYANGNTDGSTWNYRSALTISDYPSPLNQCPEQKVCTSVQGIAMGNTCP